MGDVRDLLVRGRQWELYHLEDDFSQAVDLAAKEPQKLRELQDLFMADAARYNVLPLDDRFAERLDVTLRPSYFFGRKKITFYPGLPVFLKAAARSWWASRSR